MNECAIRNLPISIKIIFLQLHAGIVGTFMTLKCYSRGMSEAIRLVLFFRRRLFEHHSYFAFLVTGNLLPE